MRADFIFSLHAFVHHQADFSDDGKVRTELNASDFATAFGVPGFLDGSAGGNFQISSRVTLTDLFQLMSGLLCDPIQRVFD